MTIRNLLTILAIGVPSFGATLGFADERIWLNGTKINGESVKLCFDSGANINALFPGAVKRLGLKFNPAPTNSLSPKVLLGDTEGYTLNINETQVRTTFIFLGFPGYVDVDVDGLIGWWPLRQNVLRIDAGARKVTFLPKMPRRAANWTRFSVITNFGTLELEVPHAACANGIMSIDTGSDCGMELPTREWHQWKEAHPHSPITLKAFYTPSDGFVVREEAWADQVYIGPLVLTGVPIIEEIPSAATRLGDKHHGTLGLAALSRLNLIVDGKNSIAYLQPKTTRSPAYPHNRLGAVFVPTTMHTNEAVALVVPYSPAYEAGIRNGDVLLQVDGIPVTGWSNNWFSHFSMPPGSKLHLTLQREGKDFKTTATLRQIIPP